MTEASFDLFVICCRLLMVLLCGLVVAKRYKCSGNCSLIRRRCECLLSWLSAGVVGIGMFFPVPAGIATVVLIVNMLWMQANESQNSQRKAIVVKSATAKNSPASEGRS
jgi:hypothetical protein